MTNKELRDQGYLYDATDNDPQMAKERVDVKALCFEFSTRLLVKQVKMFLFCQVSTAITATTLKLAITSLLTTTW